MSPPPGLEAVGLPLLAALGLLGAVLALDETAVGQTWLSQPLPAAVLAASICGHPAAGLAVGVPLQLIGLGNMPVGRGFLGDRVAGTVAAVGGLLTATTPHPAAALTGPAAATTGWLLLGAVLIGAAGHWVGVAERRAHVAWMLEGHRTLRDGDLGRLDRLQGRALAVTALRGFAMVVLFVPLVGGLWLPLLAALPEPLRAGLRLLPLLPAFLAAGLLLERFGLRRSWGWVGAGLLVGWLLAGAGT